MIQAMSVVVRCFWCAAQMGKMPDYPRDAHGRPFALCPDCRKGIKVAIQLGELSARMRLENIHARTPEPRRL